MKPTVYAVILNWNRAADTEECVRSVLASDYPALKVLLVDNGSTEERSVALGKAFGEIEFIRSETNLGYTGGNNLGISRAAAEGADYVFLLNNDTVVDPACVSLLVEAAEKDPAAGITAPLVFSYEQKDKVLTSGGTIRWARGKTEESTRLPDGTRAVDFASGCGMLVGRGVIERAGQLDTRFFLFFEDVEFCARAAKRGFKVTVQPGAKIWHKVSTSIGHTRSAESVYYGLRNKLLFLREYGSIWSNAVYFTVFLPFSLIKNALLYAGDPRREKALFLGLRDFFAGRTGKGGWS